MLSKNVSTLIYLHVHSQEFWYILSGLDIQPEQS